ncbi:MAG: molybdopterin-binding protein [Prolixibacteraceae bacterium]
MNKLPAKITTIQQSGTILLVDAEVEDQGFSALIIESAERPEWLGVGKGVDLVFKETEVSLAKDLQGKISTRNRMKCQILKIDKGELLSMITLKYGQYIVVSAITTRSVHALQLKIGDEVEALVKANEVSLKKKK